MKPGWVDPTVLALCLLGGVGAVALLAGRVRVAISTAILGAALGGAGVVFADYREVWIRCVVERTGFNHLPVPLPTLSCVPHVTYYRAGWVGGTALGVVLLGVALVTGVLLIARRNPC